MTGPLSSLRVSGNRPRKHSQRHFMAELTVEESDRGGLRLRKYRPFQPGRLASERENASTGTLTATEAIAAE